MQRYKSGQEKLINFFSKYTVDYAEKGEGKNQLVKLFGADSWLQLIQFDEYYLNYQFITRLRKQLDSSLAGLYGIAQVQACLTLLLDKWENDEEEQFKILLQLIKNENSECLYNGWDETFKNHFDEAYQVLFRWNDFFFSYTNRNLPETNNDFYALITHTFDKDEVEKNKNKINYLAKLIVWYLTRKNLRSFYDQDTIVCGEEFQEKILEHCKSSFVFIQLIEEMVFHKPKDKKNNWCFIEFTEFDQCLNSSINDNDDCNRYFFILTHEPKIVFSGMAPKKYESWQNKIKSLDYVAIVHGLNNLELNEKLIVLVEQIKKTKTNVFKHYLGNFFEPEKLY